MNSLTKREEQVMEAIIKLKQAFIRDIREAMPAPQPHYNTVATLVKFLEEKGAVTKEKVGNTYRYSPAEDFLQAYRDRSISTIQERFFDNSLPKMINWRLFRPPGDRSIAGMQCWPPVVGVARWRPRPVWICHLSLTRSR